MKAKTIILCAAMLFLLGGMAVGQSNERIDELLRQGVAEAGHGAYLVLTAAGAVPESADPGEALAAAQEAGLLPGRMERTDLLSFGQFAYLLTESFGVPGGVMYRVLPGPRYAAREVVYQGWSRKRRAPSDPIAGESLVRIVSVYLNETGGAQ